MFVVLKIEAEEVANTLLLLLNITASDHFESISEVSVDL